jgi:hypothetical protein
LNILVVSFPEPNWPPAVFMCADEVQVLSGARLDVFPCEELIVSRRYTSYLEAARAVGGRRLIEVGSMTQRRIGNESDHPICQWFLPRIDDIAFDARCIGSDHDLEWIFRNTVYPKSI